MENIMDRQLTLSEQYYVVLDDDVDNNLPPMDMGGCNIYFHGDHFDFESTYDIERADMLAYVASDAERRQLECNALRQMAYIGTIIVTNINLQTWIAQQDVEPSPDDIHSWGYEMLVHNLKVVGEFDIDVKHTETRTVSTGPGVPGLYGLL